VGECRGGEALDMLQAMNTGHDGSLTTAHANTPRDCLSRLEVMTLMSGLDIPVQAIREQICSAVNLIVQQTRFSCGTRRVTYITEVTGIERDIVQMQDVFTSSRKASTPKVASRATSSPPATSRSSTKTSSSAASRWTPPSSAMARRCSISTPAGGPEMDDGLLIFVIAFAVLGAGLIWAGLHFGGRWFRNRQSRDASAAAQALEGMFIFTGTQRLQTVSLVVTILLPVVAWFLTGNLFIVGICVVLAFVSPKWVVRFIAKRRLNQFEQQLPDSLLMITGALRAGASLPIALESVASEGKPPISQEFELLLRELRLGVDFAVALRNLEKRVPLSDLAMVTAGMALSREVGANLAETLDSIAKTIRAKLQMEGKIKSLTAQGKMQGLVMAGLPVFLILVLRFMEPEAMEPMFTTWYGWATVAVITVADMIGYFFIRKITAIDV